MDTSSKIFILYSSKVEHMSLKTNPLDIPEIVCLVGRYLDKATEIAALAVSPTFRSQISATAWKRIVVDLKNNALYRPDGSEEGRDRLLPWKSLELYAPHVRTIELKSLVHPSSRPPTSYPRPASVRDVLIMLGELPNIERMTLDISGVEGTDLPQIFKICSRLKSLDIRKCRMIIQGTASVNVISNMIREWEASAHKSAYDLEELSLSTTCGIGLSDFLSRSPRLRVLRLYDKRGQGYSGEQAMKDLVKSFKTEGSMPKTLQHLDVSISQEALVGGDTICKVLGSVRCLREFECSSVGPEKWSIDDFQPHFSTLTSINVNGKPEFWQEVMSLCPALLSAGVELFAEDLIGGRRWACTRLESLKLKVCVRSEGNVGSSREAQEEALFQRIAKLEELKDLLVYTEWDDEMTLRAESWGVLLGMKSLKSVTLGEELTASRDMPNVLRRFSEKQVKLTWLREDGFDSD